MAITQITPEEAHRRMQDGEPYIDVRTEQEFANGHPAGAVNIPVVFPDPATRQMKVNGDFLRVVAAHFPKDTAVIVGCQAGGRSQRAAEMLQGAGYTAVSNMQGGFGGARDATGRTVVAGWAASGLPVSNECNDKNSYIGLQRAGERK